MRFVDDEFLLSRGRRFSPGTEERLARALVADQARRDLRARKQRNEGRLPRKVQARVFAPVRATFGGGRHRS
jgi:hypothetical protein